MGACVSSTESGLRPLLVRQTDCVMDYLSGNQRGRTGSTATSMEDSIQRVVLFLYALGSFLRELILKLELFFIVWLLLRLLNVFIFHIVRKDMCSCQP